MKRRARAFTGLLLCMLFILPASGCRKQEPVETVNVALLVGNHKNAAAPNYTAAKPYIKEACESFGSVSIIAVDGAPYQTAQADIPVPEKSLSQSKLKSVAASQEEEIMALAEESRAKSPEVDTLKAIELGVRSLRSRDNGASKMVILDSGVCTAGSLDFTSSLLEAVDPDNATESLKKQNALPDMEGISVAWIGLGDTQAPQEPLTAKNAKVLKSVWEKVLTAAGAKAEFLSDLPAGQVKVPDLPEVTAIEVLKPISAIKESGYQPADTLVLDQETLNFKPDSAELLSDQDALQLVLIPIANYMKEKKEYQILLCGTTATAGTQDTAAELSKLRCDAVKQTLISMGVEEAQIQTLGLGYEDHPFHVNDVNADGSLNDGLAKQNRAVMILPKGSKMAVDLIRKYGI